MAGNKSLQRDIIGETLLQMSSAENEPRTMSSHGSFPEALELQELSQIYPRYFHARKITQHSVLCLSKLPL